MGSIYNHQFIYYRGEWLITKSTQFNNDADLYRNNDFFSRTSYSCRKTYVDFLFEEAVRYPELSQAIFPIYMLSNLPGDLKTAYYLIPIADFTEKTDSYLNVDGYLQTAKKAISNARYFTIQSWFTTKVNYNIFNLLNKRNFDVELKRRPRKRKTISWRQGYITYIKV